MLVSLTIELWILLLRPMLDTLYQMGFPLSDSSLYHTIVGEFDYLIVTDLVLILHI